MKDITGQKFNKLTALKFVKTLHHSHPYWLFQCDCGEKKVIGWYNVKSGNTTSCGCEHKRVASATASTHRFTTNKRRMRFYLAWQSMRARCLNKKHASFKWYGAQGVKICSRWMNFEKFRDDMYSSYCSHVRRFGEKNTLLDQIDNDGDYSPDNCRWATWKEQSNHRRNNHYVEWQGKIKSLTDWCETLLLPYDRIKQRLDKLKWPVERAFTT